MSLPASSRVAAGPGTSDDPWLPAAAMLPTFLLAYGVLMLACDTHRVAIFWPADAVVVAALLQMRPRIWWQGLLAGFMGLVFARWLIGCTALTALAFSTINLAEILTCAGLLRRVAPRLDLKRPTHLGLFVITAGLVAPSISAVAAGELLSVVRGAPFWSTAWSWYVGDAVGLLTVTPVVLAIARLLQPGRGAALRASQPWDAPNPVRRCPGHAANHKREDVGRRARELEAGSPSDLSSARDAESASSPAWKSD